MRIARESSQLSMRLKPQGYYLISTAVMDEEHQKLLQKDRWVQDASTGIVYTHYDDGLIDLDSGVVYETLDSGPDELPDAIKINCRWYLPNRRHVRPDVLETELSKAGFRVICRYNQYAGSVACVQDH